MDNRYRFYEILKAAKNGEDLGNYEPRNAAEAQLLANLMGGSGSSSGGVEMFNIAELETVAEGSGQAILDAYNAGKKLVYIERIYDGSSGNYTTCIYSVVSVRQYSDDMQHVMVDIINIANIPDEDGSPEKTPLLIVKQYTL